MECAYSVLKLKSALNSTLTGTRGTHGWKRSNYGNDCGNYYLESDWLKSFFHRICTVIS